MHAKLGQNVRVLLEKRKGHSVWGKTEHFLPVRIENLAENDVIGTFVTVTLTDIACEAASLASPDKLIFVGKAL